MCLMHQDLMVKQENLSYNLNVWICFTSRWFDFLYIKVNTCSITDNCQVFESCY